MSFKTIAAALVLAASLHAPTIAQDHSSTHHGSAETAAPAGDTSASSKAFAEANARMHKGMDIAFTGNTDADFVRGMIAHHQGAIDMAKVELEYGKDDQLRKLAEDIIKAQEGEIEMMKNWLVKNGG
ncbi:CopM family metallochaperone [Ensifer sp. 4252]|uniref:CopM family metallochaperone n=1 Tax=Ensifer sp. 4252 TaxID=3373915 RepID=UPI003D20E6F2